MIYWQNAQTTLLQTLIEQPRLGVITDMDGTISPIVDKPDAALITSRSREALLGLQSTLTLVAAVSGRGVEDLRARVAVPGMVYIGNHGLERWVDDRVELLPAAAAFRPAVAAAAGALRERQLPGMVIEDKTATLSVHYRQTSDPQTVAREFAPIVQEIATQQGLAFFQGRMVFELRPPVKVDKGTAFAALVTDYALDGAVYLGDDTTDADALRMARQLRETGSCYTLGIGVDSDDTPAIVRDSADLLANGVSAVEDFLLWLLMARKASST